MKRLLLILILTFSFQSLTKADDVSDYTVENFTVGDSLLNFYSYKEIKEKINSKSTFWYPDNIYASILVKSKKFKVYEEVGIVINTKEDKFIILSIEGTFNFQSNIDECYKKQRIITADLKNDFSLNTKFNTYKIKYKFDKSGKSTANYDDFIFADGSAIRVICYDMDEDFIDPNDQLYLAINSKKFMNYLTNMK